MKSLVNGRELNNNQLSGTIPATIGALTNLQILYGILQHNPFCYDQPSSPNYLGSGTLVNMRDDGVLWIVHSTSISSQEPFHQLLELSPTFKFCTGTHFNLLASVQPLVFDFFFISNFSGISISEFFSNQLSGSIPFTIGSLLNLQYMYGTTLFETCFSGSSSAISNLISSFCNVPNSTLNNNQLSGTIPSTVASLLNLHYMYESDYYLRRPDSISA